LPRPAPRHPKRTGGDDAPARESKASTRGANGLRLLCALAAILCPVWAWSYAASVDQAAARSPARRPAAGPTPDSRPRDANGPDDAGGDEVVRVESNLVVIPASVTDGRGVAVTGLRLEDFELRVDGEAQPLSDLSRAETPVSIALLYDNSSSLSAARGFEKQAAFRFLRSVVRPVDRAAVYSVSTTPALAQELTQDVGRLVAAVERFGMPDGATALFDALAQAADYMRPVAGRKVLLVVSDGADTVSDITFEEAVNRVLRADCQVYVVQTVRAGEPHLRDTVSEQRMRTLAEQTGGSAYAPRSGEDLDAAFAQIALDLSQQYILSYYPRRERGDKRFRLISLGVKARPDARVRARKGFYHPALDSQAPGGGSTPARP
jgi:Ca-activated chloride channel homolog